LHFESPSAKLLLPHKKWHKKGHQEFPRTLENCQMVSIPKECLLRTHYCKSSTLP
jgi:hypothetical protein